LALGLIQVADHCEKIHLAFSQSVMVGGLTVEEAKLQMESSLGDLREAQSLAKQFLREWYGI
jgi:hypothetical protein